MLDSNILLTTPFGRPANVNNASQGEPLIADGYSHLAFSPLIRMCHKRR